MAAKYEEVIIPTIGIFVGIVAPQYQITKEAILDLESSLLLLLDFNLGYTSPLVFIAEVCMSNRLSSEVKMRANQLARKLILTSDA